MNIVRIPHKITSVLTKKIPTIFFPPNNQNHNEIQIYLYFFVHINLI